MRSLYVIVPAKSMNSYFANLLLIAAGCALVAYTVHSLRTRELAVALARRHCQKMDLQLLDQSVSLCSLRLHNSGNLRLAVAKTYQFEFTATGEERYKGRITMHNQQLADLWLQPHRLTDTEPTSGDPTTNSFNSF